MGIHHSKKDPEYETSLALFTKEEHEKICKLFKDISGSHATFSHDQLQAHAGKYLPRNYVHRLHDVMANVISKRPRQNAQVPYQAFLISLSHMLKGTLTQRGHIIRRLASDNRETTASEELINRCCARAH
ncbi:PREDICTED: uncharacterized protein LOC106805013 [Priapulus caudatus]|uniref:Uncharacterized protein LOC106805013 n=1 Tax=Priapulus caudatus TaxID=37621 RepID=A0ABM1DPU3_PRICU|nr:PREDICTED: uncharacterized protein LOC106805013 [Priapulus caudatus]